MFIPGFLLWKGIGNIGGQPLEVCSCPSSKLYYRIVEILHVLSFKAVMSVDNCVR